MFIHHRSSRRIRKQEWGWLAQVSLSALVLFIIIGLVSGKINSEVQPQVRYAESIKDMKRRCEKYGSKCQIYACYRTDKGKFVCQQ